MLNTPIPQKTLGLGALSKKRAVVRLGLGTFQFFSACGYHLFVLSRSLVSCQDGPITLCGTQEWAVTTGSQVGRNWCRCSWSPLCGAQIRSPAFGRAGVFIVIPIGHRTLVPNVTLIPTCWLSTGVMVVGILAERDYSCLRMLIGLYLGLWGPF